MRRGKIGDVYYVEVPNGYKLYQWAYRIDKRGDYIRVFDGLFKTLPENLTQIVEGPHSYIIGFFSNRAYRIGLAKLIGNFPVPHQYPYPDFCFQPWINQKGKIFCIDVAPTNKEVMGNYNTMSFSVSSIEELPAEYRDLKLFRSIVTPPWLLYLFNHDFNLKDLTRFWPGESSEDELNVYLNRVEELLRLDREKRNLGKGTKNL